MSNDQRADSPLQFDPNEPVVAFGVETGKPLGTHRPSKIEPAKTTIVQQTDREHNHNDVPQTARPVQARAVITEGPTTPVSHINAIEANDVEDKPVHKIRPRLPLVSRIGVREVTAAYEDISLPSEFASYPWKDLQIRRFNIEELRAIVRSRTSGNLRHLIRAIDSTLSRPVTELTQGDFWYIMYWHRLNSYKKSPFVIEWVCTDPKHLEKVESGAAKGETLRNVLTVGKSNLDTQSIKLDKYTAMRDALWAEYSVKVRPQYVVDFVSATDEDEELEYARKLKKEEQATAAETGDVDTFLEELENAETLGADEDRGFIYRYAALIDPSHGESLQERVTYLDGQDPDLLVDLEDFLAVSDHGVTESWKCICKECGASKVVKQSLDALTFLPSLQRGGLT